MTNETQTSDTALRAELARLKEMCEAATDGPWVCHPSPEDVEAGLPYPEILVTEKVPLGEVVFSTYLEYDAEFIAESRTALPRLIAALEETIAAGNALRDAAMRSGIIQANNAVPPDERMVEIKDGDLLDSTTALFRAMDAWDAAIAQALTEGGDGE